MPALLPRAIASAPSRRVAPLGSAPAPATAPPLTRLGAACARGWATSPPSSRHTSWSGSTARLGLNSLASRQRRAGARSPLPRSKLPRQPTRPCARNGQSGPREDRRGSSRRPAALFCPRVAGFGWGRAIQINNQHCSIVLPKQINNTPQIFYKNLLISHILILIRYPP